MNGVQAHDFRGDRLIAYVRCNGLLWENKIEMYKVYNRLTTDEM